MGEIVITDRSRLIFDEKPDNVSANLTDDDKWHVTARFGVRSVVPGQPSGGHVGVDIEIDCPVDSDHRYTFTVPADKLERAVREFISRLCHLSGLESIISQPGGSDSKDE